jgi:hypothetical protein
MANNSINAASNPALANQLAQEALSAPEEQIEKATITAPSDNVVNLPGGYVTPTGEVLKVAEVRELTGRDEEALGKSTPSRKFATILNRAVTTVGGVKATESILDGLLAGDRDALLLGIYRVTFGSEAELPTFCEGCKEFKTVSINIDQDIPVKVLADPIADRTFTVRGKKNEFLVTLPTGVTQKLLIAADEKNSAELTTILLENTVLEINGQSVYSPIQIQNLGILDRRLLVEEIAKRGPGPVFESSTVNCPDCDGEVLVSTSLGNLFRL